MPEVVYPSGERTWDEVFPIWKTEEDTEWRFINTILEHIAMNNRFGDKTTDQLETYLEEVCLKQAVEDLEKNGVDVEKRHKTFLSYGLTHYYIKQVFANLGGAYREHKAR